jgi:Fic family protein
MRTRYLDIDDRTEDLAELMRDEPAIAEDFLKKYELSWIHHENALEGVVFSAQEMELALAHQPLADANVLSAQQEIRNDKTAIDVVRAEAKAKKLRINITLVKRLYETLGMNIEGRSAAEYRRDIPLHRAYFHEIAAPAKIPVLLGKVFDLCESAEFRGFHPLQQASKLHHAFMQIYPFTENSGKVARLLANLILLHHDYLPCLIHAIDRQRYYESLRVPETTLRDLMMEAMDNGLANAEKFFEQAMAARAKKVAR